MNYEVFDRVFNSLKERLESDENIVIKVYSKPTGSVYPLVVIKRIDYRQLTRAYPTSVVSIEVDIFAKEAMMTGKRTSNENVARHIECIVSEHMMELGLILRSSVPTPHVDSTIHRITMRFDGTIDDFRSRIY